MMAKHYSPPRKAAQPIGLDRFQAAVVTDTGEEIPITEAMILRACQALDASLAPVPRPLNRQNRRHADH